MFSEKNEREREGGLEWVDKVEEKMCDREQIERMMGNEYWDAE